MRTMETNTLIIIGIGLIASAVAGWGRGVMLHGKRVGHEAFPQRDEGIGADGTGGATCV